MLFAEIKDKENEQLTKYLKEDEEKKDDVNKEEYNYDYDDYDDYYNYDDYEENARRTI